MSELNRLNLTEKDFDLMVEGLDSLSEKGIAGEFMGDLFGAMLTKDEDADSKRKFEMEREKRRKENENKQRELKEDIRILQGKLLMLKRYLIEQGALDETYKIINYSGK